MLTFGASVVCSTLAFAAPPAPIVVADTGEVPPYDAGYAYQASVMCPNLTLVFPIGPEAQANADFKRGTAMFERYLSLQKIEGACKAALNLYDEKTGKSAKILGRK
jgi:hypothetical protein